MTINFSNNWNGKLFNDCFSTIRLYNSDTFYLGAEIDIQLKRQELGTAKIVAVRKFRFEQIDDFIGFTETGKPAAYLSTITKKFYLNHFQLTPGVYLHHIVFQYIKRNIPVQTELIKHWWDEKTAQEDPVTPQSNENLLFT